MKKKLTALLAVSLAMLVVSPVNAFASFNDFNKRTTKINGKCSMPDVAIEVTVNSNTDTYMNPKSAPVTINGQVTRRKIVSDTSYIENKSEVPVSVSAKVTCRVNSGSNLQLTEKSTQSLGITDKAAFIYFEMQAVNSATRKAWDSEYDPDKHILLVDGDTTEKEDFIVIGAASQKKHFGVFRLTGDCVAKPENDSWNEDDGVTATIAFTFKAVPYSEGA
jgi:hypothetical protein